MAKKLAERRKRAYELHASIGQAIIEREISRAIIGILEHTKYHTELKARIHKYIEEFFERG